MKNQKDSFAEGKVETYSNGKRSFLNFFKEKTCIKDLDGKILYEGRGNFQEVLEKAVKKVVELPRADLRDQFFKGLCIPNAKIPGASFENSILADEYLPIISSAPLINSTDMTKADLRDVSFKNARIKGNYVLFGKSNVEGADFGNIDISEIYDLGKIENLDKAHNVKETNLKVWKSVREKAAAIEAALLKKTKAGR